MLIWHAEKIRIRIYREIPQGGDGTAHNWRRLPTQVPNRHAYYKHEGKA